MQGKGAPQVSGFAALTGKDGLMLDPSNLTNRWRVLRREIRVKVHNHGTLGALKLGTRRLLNQVRSSVSSKSNKVDEFDLNFGTDTDGVVEVGALDIPDRDAVHAIRYQTAMIDVFREILSGLLIPYEDFLFVDLGSGKGRALLLASDFPFKGIVGVELSPSLHRIAGENIRIYRSPSQRCHHIESICASVADYRIPNENVAFYLFNPFDEQVMRTVLSRIEASLQELGKEICIMYLKTLHRQVFDHSEYFHVVRDTERYVIYASNVVERAKHVINT